MDPSWLGSFILALVFLVFFYTPGPGRRLRHWVVGRFWRRVFQSGRVIVSLRVVDGAQAGVRGRVVGSALMTPGRVGFTRWVGGLPLVRRPMPDMAVTAVGTPSKPQGLAMLRFGDPDVRLVHLRTPTATLELAILPPASADEVLARLRVPGPLQSL